MGRQGGLHALTFLDGENNRSHTLAARINHLLVTDHDRARLEAELVARGENPASHARLTLIATQRAKRHRQFLPE